LFRYMAFAWNEAHSAPTDVAQLLARRLQLTSRQWTRALALPGLQVFYVGKRTGSSEPIALPRSAGIILGTLFEACGADAQPRRKQNFSSTETDRILSTGGCSLSSDFWGRYVAFAHDAAQRKTSILRDPTGGLPCLRATYRDVHLFFSSADDCASLGLLDLSIHWEFIAQHLAFDNPCSRRTAIREISTVLAGERAQIQHGGMTRSFAWNPLQIAQSNVIENSNDAARELRRATKACIHAWAGCYQGVLHTLSGGLDSAIVLSCLGDAQDRPTITCLNYHSGGAGGDERYFARLAANHTGCPLLEWERDNAVRLEDLQAMERTAAPARLLHWLQVSRREARLAGEICADAIFSGCGGDELFYRTGGMLGAADYLRLRGVNRRFIEVALDTAHLENCSLWHVIREAFSHRRVKHRWHPRIHASVGRKLVTPDVRARAHEYDDVTHPLLAAPSDAPPGKWWHAYSLAMPLEYYDPLALPSYPERVQPLMSQPLIELCLRIPTYVLASKGWDRAVARQAFSDDVPREILRRRTKQGMQENIADILARNIDSARELLLDGHLVGEGLLDRGRIEAAFADNAAPDNCIAREIFDHISTEVWLRSWKLPVDQSAAAAMRI
jgi:asparagine synthase (glutamine-hydrolysing)